MCSCDGITDDARLGPLARELIADPQNDVFVSAASAWEISIKKALGKLIAPDDLSVIAAEEGFESLPISFYYAKRAGGLPRHHGVPFDRMLVAQSQAEGLDIVTADEKIGQYGIRTIHAGR